jgi:glutaredoxin/glutathione-dependent peroxiredoxin
MSIKPGDRIPSATLRTPKADGPANITTDEIFSGKTVVLFAVPGAFTPTCQNNHLPGYIELKDELRAKGAETIAVVAVNDVFVMDAWRKANAGGDSDAGILFLADGNADFTRATGLDVDLTAKGFGTRSQRYSMLVRDGVVETLNIEDAPGQAEKSSARVMLDQLGSARS